MIYLDNAATTRVFDSVVKEMERYYSEEYFNPSALYSPAFEVVKKIAAARAYLCDKLGGGGKLYFTSCATESNAWVYNCGVKNKKGNILVSMGEHASGYENARALADKGFDVRFVKLCADGTVDISDYQSKLDENTTLASVIHCSNETGAINDIARLSRIAKQISPRCLFHSDGVQAYGKIPVKLNKEIDLYAVSAHKIGGLKGTGALIRKKSLPLAPYIFGGGQENGKRSGTENVFGIMTFYYAAEEKFARLKEEQKEAELLREEVWSALDRTLFTRLSPQDGTPYILTVSAEGLRGEVLQRMLYDNGLAVGTGSACSSKHRYSRVMTACGYGERVLDGVLRLSFSPQNTREEGLRAAKILNETANKLKEKTAD